MFSVSAVAALIAVLFLNHCQLYPAPVLPRSVTVVPVQNTPDEGEKDAPGEGMVVITTSAEVSEQLPTEAMRRKVPPVSAA